MNSIDFFTPHLLEDMKQCGIYKITNKVNNKIYIGSVCTSSTSNKKNNFRRRWQFHMNYLRKGKHSNPHLQYSFNKHGEDSFIFEIIEVIEDKYNVSLILDREQYYLDLYKPYISDIGYNKLKTSINLKINTKTKESTKEKLSKFFTGKPRPVWMKLQYGKPILQFSLDGEFIQEWYSATEAARVLNLHRQGIKDMLHGKNKTSGGFIWKYKNKNQI